MAQNETQTFQHYQVLRREDGSLFELGRGAMGITYKAFDTNLRCFVALKVVNALFLHSDTAKARFLREARAAAALRHRNVASVYHLGNDDQSFFYAMEFVDGETIASLVDKSGPLPVAQALFIALQVSRALGAAHRQNLIHRDIKPANLMVTREDVDDDEETVTEAVAPNVGQFHVKVIDFGLARSSLDAAGSSSGPITMGGFVGTAQFASPEQLEEREVDIRSDIYSLGITLWYLLAGRPPFTGSMFSLYSQHLTKEPPWEQLGDRVPAPVREVLARMLQKNPGDRYQTPSALRRALEACLSALPEGGSQATNLPARRTMLDESNSDAEHSDGGATAAASTLMPPLTAEAGPSSVATPPASSTAGTSPAQPGAILGGRYRLVSLVGEGGAGRVFYAVDTAEGERPVALKLAYSGAGANAEANARLERELAKLRAAPHPHLLAAFALGRHGDTPFLVTEWVNGFSLLDVLRHRGRLSLEEALPLLRQAAGAADHAGAHGLEEFELSARQTLLQFLGEPNLPNGGARRHLRTSPTVWPAVALKASALGLPTPEASHAESATWSGEMTVIASFRPTASALVSGPAAVRQAAGALALLAYELLDGTPPDETVTSGGRYHSLAALNEPANDLLRRVLTAGSRGGNDVVPGSESASAGAFCEALARVAGVESAALAVAATSGGASALARSLAIEPPTPLVDSPAASAADDGGDGSATAARAAAPVQGASAPPAPSRVVPWPPLDPASPPHGRRGVPWIPIGASALLLLALAVGAGTWLRRGQPTANAPSIVSTPSPAAAADSPSSGGSPVPSPSPEPALAASPTPSPKPAGPQTLTVPGQFRTIQAAVEAARAGDTVLVNPGSYQGAILFKEGIRLAGADAANCLITPGENDGGPASALLKVSDCRTGTVENLTFQGGGGVGPLGVKQDGILLTNSSVTVRGCRISAMSGSGIVVHDTDSRPTIKGNRCRANGEHGLVFERGANGTAENNVLEKNEGCGIIVADRGTNPTLVRNEARENRRHGLNFLRGSTGVAEENVLANNDLSGIAVDSSDTVPTLRLNRSTGNRQHGLGYARGAGGLAEENTLENNVGSGILVHGSDTAPTLRHNRSLHNRLNGLAFEKGAAGLAENNVLDSNEGCGILISDPLTAPTLTGNEATKNKQFGLATVNAPQIKPDPSNRFTDNSRGPITRK